MKINIIVRFSDASAGAGEQPDLNIPISINFGRDDVNRLVNSSWLKLMIRSKVESTSRKRLRLIYNGRILNDQTDFKTEIFDPKLRQTRASESPNEPMELYVHCLIGEKMTREQLSQEREWDSQTQQQSSDAPVIGFDRLLSQGMNASDVNDLRRQFQQIYFPEGNQSPGAEAVTDIEEEERRQQFVRELEERWLEGTSGSNAPHTGSRPTTQRQDETDPESAGGHQNLAERAAAELEGTHHNENLLLGLLLGTFLGAVALVFLLMDDSSFNDAQKMAMILGISINLFIAFMRVGSEYSA